MVTIPEWCKEATERVENLLAELAREGKLHHAGRGGMLLHATVLIETVDAEEGEDWWTVLQLPNDKVRELVYHRWMISKFLHDNVGSETSDSEDP